MMPLEGAMLRLKNAADRLNRESDKLAKTLAEFEDELNSYDIGVSCWHEGIGYAKLDGKWRLVVEYAGQTVALVHASRIVRIEAVEKLDGLVRLLTEKVESYLSSFSL